MNVLRYQLRRVCVFLTFVLLAAGGTVFANDQLGAALYIAPLSENPRAGNNFTATIKVDSLAEPINAVKGVLTFNKDRLEIITVSKIGSILNLWVEEPRISNIEGTLKFQGGVPKPGLIGNGGVVLYVIFRAKSAGPTGLVWKDGEVLAADGKGTNILTNLQNLDFMVDESAIVSRASPAPLVPQWQNPLVIVNLVFLFVFVCFGLFFSLTKALQYHDKNARHHGEDDINHEGYHDDVHHHEEYHEGNFNFVQRSTS